MNATTQHMTTNNHKHMKTTETNMKTTKQAHEHKQNMETTHSEGKQKQ